MVCWNGGNGNGTGISGIVGGLGVVGVNNYGGFDGRVGGANNGKYIIKENVKKVLKPKRKIVVVP